MRKYKLLHNRLFIYICTLYLTGLLSGVFIFRGNKVLITFTDSSFIKIFFNNYWYILLMWAFGFSAVGLIFNTLITYFRGFLFGVLIVVLISNDMSKLGLLTLLEIFLFIPIFFTLSYVSINISMSVLYSMLHSYRSRVMEFNKYLNLIFIITLLMIIYSIFVSLT